MAVRVSGILTGILDLQGLLALQAYRMNDGNEGSSLTTGISTRGLYPAIKKLISAAWDLYSNFPELR